jgi:hypothetical protein
MRSDRMVGYGYAFYHAMGITYVIALATETTRAQHLSIGSLIPVFCISAVAFLPGFVGSMAISFGKRWGFVLLAIVEGFWILAEGVIALAETLAPTAGLTQFPTSSWFVLIHIAVFAYCVARLKGRLGPIPA